MSKAKINPMNDVITEYQKWKQQGEDLRAQAKQAMEARFRELLSEAVQVAQEYHHDFGLSLKPPAGITAFRYKATGNAKPKKTAKPAAAARKPEPPPAVPTRKVAGLKKRLETARKKLETAKTAGAPTKNLEDRIYEIEDDLRLASQ